MQYSIRSLPGKPILDLDQLMQHCRGLAIPMLRIHSSEMLILASSLTLTVCALCVLFFAM
jgi:hypothetical protein